MKKLLRAALALLLVLCFALPAGALTVEQALGLLDETYIDEIPAEARNAKTVQELVSLLGDPYTVYMTAEEYTSFVDHVNNTSIVGIGVSIEYAEDGVLIASVLDDSPAQEAGLEAGDVILSVDGTVPTGLDHARTLISGVVGTPVRLTVKKTDGTTVTPELTRREILVHVTIKAGMLNDVRAALLQCETFGETTAQEFADTLDKYSGDSDVILIDLSRNPGGISQAAAAATGCFIGGGIMLYFRDRGDHYTYTYTLPGTEQHTDKPAILMTGPFTASASELFLAAMRDHGAGISIGQRTFGKGVAQYAFDETTHPDLFDGDALKVTVYRFFSPNGVTNDKVGVFPTLLIDLDRTFDAAALLCAGEPADPKGYLNVELAGWDFFINLDMAMSERYRDSFVALLEALPPYAGLWKDGGGRFTKTTVDEVVSTLGLTEYQKRTFTDLEGCKQAEAIQTLRTYDLVSGYGDGTFRPDDLLTRAEFCAMLGSILKMDLPPVTASRFTDVDTSAWYAPVVHAMQEQGLLSGYGDGTFRPENPISQEEAVSILAAAAVRLNMNAYNKRLATLTEEEQAPYAAFSPWARKSAWLLSSLEMDLRWLYPQSSASRGVAAELVCDMLTQAGLLWK